MKKRVADILVDCLIENGITDCFSVVGGGAMHLNNAFVLRDEINKIYCHHEQACAMAAEGYARASGKLAVVCVTSGPGGTNAINGVQGAYVDSIPMIVISGHPRQNTTVAATGLNLRCRGVQENDIVHMVKKITKYAKFITDASTIRDEIKKAINVAMEGRRGPVWLDIPLDIQGALVDDICVDTKIHEKKDTIDENDINECIDMLQSAKCPCILTGSGIRTSDAIEQFRTFCSKVQIPIVGGALQADVCYNGQNMYYGMSGSMGPRVGNFILQNADVILVLGNSLSFKQTGFNQELFAPNAKIVMVDIDRDESKKPGIRIEKFICEELKDFFDVICKRDVVIKAKDNWVSYCDMLMKRFDKFEALTLIDEIKSDDRVPVSLFWKEFMEQCKKDVIIALGNSSCVHGILQEGVNTSEQRVLVNYNCGSMGDDLPEAVGAAVAMNKEVICITGDGSVMMNIQEFQTIKYNRLPVKTIIFSNNGYGAIRNTCSKFFAGTYTGCDENSGISFPEFEKVATAFDLPFSKCRNVGELSESIEWLVNHKGACILEIEQCIDEIKAPRLESKMLEDGTFVTPALHDMSPFLSKSELEELMFNE